MLEKFQLKHWASLVDANMNMIFKWNKDEMDGAVWSAYYRDYCQIHGNRKVKHKAYMIQERRTLS